VLTDVQMAEMEDCEGVIATERYGSQESWKYLLKDRRIKRQKEAMDGRLAGNSMSGVFKVRDSFRKARKSFRTYTKTKTLLDVTN